MKKLFNLALSVNQLRKTVGYNTIVEAMKCDLRLRIVDNPNQFLSLRGGNPTKQSRRVLVLSPHPDDDVFGCGGTIIKHIENGDKVNILYFCDGSHGTKNGKRDLSLIKTRHEETKKSAQIMGINENDLIFWNNEDGKLADNKTAVDKLLKLIQELKPQIIYLPSILDDNLDHKTVNKIFYKVLSFCHSEPIRLCSGQAGVEERLSNILLSMYEIWTPILPNRLINITDVVEIKKRAIQAHKSQLICRNYDEAILALSKYRAIINNVSGFAEGFFVCTPKIYKSFFKNCPV